MRVVELLAAGDVEGVAQLSNAPDRRREVLQAYKARIGEEEFRRIFGRYKDVPIVEEMAIGEHRMIIRRLPEPEGRLAAQYFVQVNGRFFIDDVPSEARERLRGALQRYREATPSKQTD